MTSARQKNIIAEIRRLALEVEELKRRRGEILSGAASASISSGDGSKSYSNWTPAQIDKAIADDEERIAALRRKLAGRPALAIGHVKIVRF